ncbi:TNF receptor superfamily member 10b [Chelydra serpentina]|uniref:TNF receptor superfamily member 10b n=1 Tax=Chelydra serpentina TaxID=8475 RepID=A0A8T1RXB8_CHESE|nr:TNF receptor superfamily member 10b [Chelydra serpentina]
MNWIYLRTYTTVHRHLLKWSFLKYLVMLFFLFFPELSDSFYYFIKEVPSRNWNMFMRTHLTDNEIDKTTFEHPKNIEERYYQMLIIWKNKFGNEVSIIKLLDSLWNIGLRRSHENLVNHLISKDIITILEAED